MEKWCGRGCKRKVMKMAGVAEGFGVSKGKTQRTGNLSWQSPLHHCSAWQWGTAEAEMKDPAVQNPEFKGFLFKPGVGPYVTMHAMPTARDFFPANFYPSNPFHLHLYQNLSWLFPVLAVANKGSSVGLQNKIGHPAHIYRQLMQVPMVINPRIEIGSKTCCFCGFPFQNCGYKYSKNDFVIVC